MAQPSNRKTSRRKGSRPTSGGRRTRGGGARGRRSGGGMVLDRRNYVLLIAGVCVIVFGYVIMRIENEVDGFISLYVAPVLILGGYLEIIYAIMWRPKSKAEPEKPEAAA